jgi:hypothetical protein
MRAHADTSFLVKLLTQEPGTAIAVADYRRLGRPSVFFLPLHSLEVANAVRQRAFHQRQFPLWIGPPSSASAIQPFRCFKNTFPGAPSLKSPMTWILRSSWREAFLRSTPSALVAVDSICSTSLWRSNSSATPF